MRFRQMAMYQGVPYEAGVGPTDSDVVLFAACPPPEELGFEPAPGHWRKRIARAEADALWESRPIGTFHGEPCLVLDDLGDRLHIAYLGKDGRHARELGYWQVDRGVYELLTPHDEVTGLTEHKAEKGLPRSGAAAMAPPMPSYPYGGQQYPLAPDPAAGPRPAAAGGRDGGPGYLGEAPSTLSGAWNGPGTGYGGPDDDPLTSKNWAGSGLPTGTGNGRNGGSRDGTGRSGSGAHRSDPLTSKNWTGTGRPASPGNGRNGSGAHRSDPLTSKDWTSHRAPGSDPLTTKNWTGTGSPYPPASPAGAAASGLATWSHLAPEAAQRRTATPATGLGYAASNGTLDAPPAGAGGQHRLTGRRSARKQRVPVRAIFSELADLAAIPRSAYALEQEADGAICLLRTDDGFEVFSAADGARHEVRAFDDEETAYFYLFGVLAAEAVRNGSLLPPR